MLEVNVLLQRKVSDIKPTKCAVAKVIELSSEEFDKFSHNLMDKWDFLSANPIEPAQDVQGRRNCLLVLGEGREDGILVDAEGGSYVRCNALLPNARMLLALDRYSCLDEQTRQLVAAADFVVSLATKKWPDDTHIEYPNRYAVDYRHLNEEFGLSFEPGDSLAYIFQAMLNERPEIETAKFGVDEFLVDAMLALDKTGPVITPAADESDMFYRNDSNTQCVGYLRGDFGQSGSEFHHTWFENNVERNTPIFKAEFQSVMDFLRTDLLKDSISSQIFCHKCPAAQLPEGAGRRYGFKLETDERRYYVRCTTLRDDYFYIFVYDKAPVPEKGFSAPERPSVLDQIREARKASPVPRKQKDVRCKDGPDL